MINLLLALDREAMISTAKIINRFNNYKYEQIKRPFGRLNCLVKFAVVNLLLCSYDGAELLV